MKTTILLYPLGLSRELEENLKHGQVNYISEVGYVVIGDTFEEVEQELRKIMDSLKQIWEPINQAGVFFFDEQEFIESLKDISDPIQRTSAYINTMLYMNGGAQTEIFESKDGKVYFGVIVPLDWDIDVAFSKIWETLREELKKRKPNGGIK